MNHPLQHRTSRRTAFAVRLPVWISDIHSTGQSLSNRWAWVLHQKWSCRQARRHSRPAGPWKDHRSPVDVHLQRRAVSHSARGPGAGRHRPSPRSTRTPARGSPPGRCRSGRSAAPAWCCRTRCRQMPPALRASRRAPLSRAWSPSPESRVKKADRDRTASR